MSIPIWTHSISPWLSGPRPTPTRRRQTRKLAGKPFIVCPRLEGLEERITPTTFNVAPSGTSLQSLHSAIAQVNQNSPPDTVRLGPGTNGPTGQTGITRSQGSLSAEGQSASVSGQTPAPTPPSMFQAWITLFIDGIESEALDQANLAGFQDTPQSLTIARDLGALLQFLGNPTSDAIQDSVAFNLMYAGPFGPLVELAGRMAVDQAISS